ncbi:MAG: alkaline phosphatase D family protein [Saprospiraceae bacterium]
MKIAFTSCCNIKQYPEQNWWNDISDQNPDYLLLLGDNIYMDYPPLIPRVKKLKRMSADLFGKEMDAMYKRQFEEPNFNKLFNKLKANNAVFGIWDDHDFLWNDSNGAAVRQEVDKNIIEIDEKLVVSRRLFHHYFQNCTSNFPHLYYSIDTIKARIIFLDTRSYSDKAGENSELLGKAQLGYLESKLEHDKEYTIICSGQTLTEYRFDKLKATAENWAGYPMQLVEFCRLIANKEKTIFLSGDIHCNRFVEPIALSKIKGILKPSAVSQAEFDILMTPPQFISSGFALKLLGFLKNWALLNFDSSGLSISFSKRNIKNKNSTSIDADVTNQANAWLQANKYYTPANA